MVAINAKVDVDHCTPAAFFAKFDQCDVVLLEAKWGERNSKDIATPEALKRYRCGLIVAEAE
jgi:hypothetical protein